MLRLRVNSFKRFAPNSQPNQQEEEKTIPKCCKDSLQQYLLNTTLHGLKYVGDGAMTRFERLFVAFTFLLVLFLSAYFISNIWYKWRQSPMIITQSAESTRVSDIPFPAVTICNINQAQKSVVSQLTQKEYAVLQSMCRRTENMHTGSSVDGKWPDYKNILLKVPQQCSEMLISCQFGKVDIDCMHVFNSILTDGGLCCTFNGLHRKFMMNSDYNLTDEIESNSNLEDLANNWSPETGFNSEMMKHNDGYPRPGLGSGKHLGLTLVLNVSVNENNNDHCSSSNGYGFKVLLHSPHELPEINEYGLSIANGYDSRIVATPIISRASDAVRHMSKKIRQCIYENENFLEFYRIYSRRNCQKECKARIFHEQCHCIMYHMPRFRPDIAICDPFNDCVAKLEDDIQSGLNDSLKCDCPYGCHDIKFEMGLSSTPLFGDAPIIHKNGLLLESTSVLQVYYDSTYYRSQDKGEIFGFTEFLSNIGGLLGLFMGFSIFSIVEIIYFVSIRPICNRIRGRVNIQRRRRGFNRSTTRLRSNASIAPSSNIMFTH